MGVGGCGVLGLCPGTGGGATVGVGTIEAAVSLKASIREPPTMPPGAPRKPNCTCPPGGMTWLYGAAVITYVSPEIDAMRASHMPVIRRGKVNCTDHAGMGADPVLRTVT